MMMVTLFNTLLCSDLFCILRWLLLSADLASPQIVSFTAPPPRAWQLRLHPSQTDRVHWFLVGLRREASLNFRRTG